MNKSTTKPIRKTSDSFVMNDFDITHINNEMRIYKKNHGQKPQIIDLTPEEQEKLRRALI